MVKGWEWKWYSTNNSSVTCLLVKKQKLSYLSFVTMKDSFTQYRRLVNARRNNCSRSISFCLHLPHPAQVKKIIPLYPLSKWRLRIFLHYFFVNIQNIASFNQKRLLTLKSRIFLFSMMNFLLLCFKITLFLSS